MVVSSIALCNALWTLCPLHRHALLLHNYKKRHRCCATKLTICTKETIKNQAKTPKAIDCVKLMRCKHLPCGPTVK